MHKLFYFLRLFQSQLYIHTGSNRRVSVETTEGSQKGRLLGKTVTIIQIVPPPLSL